MPPAPVAFTGETLGSEIVKIYIGKKRVEFHVHKKLICDTSDYFRDKFTGPSPEARERVLCLPKECPKTFSLFIGWLYRRQVPVGCDQEHFVRLHMLYAFAEKVSVVELCDRTIDTIRDMLWSYDEATTTPDLLALVYESTDVESPLRMLSIQNFTRDLSGDSAMAWTLSLDGLDVLYYLVQGNKDLFDDYFRHFSAYEGYALPSARSRKDFKYCDFHKHPISADCYALDVGKNREVPKWCSHNGSDSDDGRVIPSLD